MRVTGTAVVIGGASGIGRGVALALADAGVDIVVGDLDEQGASATAEQVVARGRRALSLRVDGTDRASLAEIAAFAEQRFGPVNLLSANVGVGLERPLADATDDDWAWMLNVNLMSAVRAVNEFLPQLRQRPGEAGVVITASMSAFLAPMVEAWDGCHRGLYVTTKHALLGYSDILRQELQTEGIQVALLCPGNVATNMSATSARYRPDSVFSPKRGAGTNDTPPLEGMDPAEVGLLAVQALEADRFTVPTPARFRPLLVERQQRFLDDLDFFAKAVGGNGDGR